LKTEKNNIDEMQKKTVIILTIFNPEIRTLLANIRTYEHQAAIIIVDNSPEPIDYNFKSVCIDYLTLGENKGIATAQNIALRKAIDEGYEYFIEMDQDTILTDGYVQKIIGEYLSLIKYDEQAFGVGPLAINSQDGLVYHNREQLKGIVNVRHTLSSGFFFSKKSVDLVGYKDDSLFIDLVDWEWCMRANSKGLKTYVTSELKIIHSLGEGHKSILGVKLGIPKAFRHYYQFRNTLELIFRNYIPINWKIVNLLKLIFKFFVYPILLPDKRKRLHFMLRGIKDGLLKIKGPLN
jgi:rhamnosyltransferase